MSNCYISDQIAEHCNREEYTEECFSCGENITEDDEAYEVLTKRSGVQFIHCECYDEFLESGF